MISGGALLKRIKNEKVKMKNMRHIATSPNHHISKYVWLLDAGHGGMENGRYTTAPDKMYTFDDGLVFHEGVNNREIVDMLIGLLQKAGIRFMKVYHLEEDTS